MIPQPNQYVIIVLHNGVRLDGNVLEWADHIVLTSKTNSITTVVPDITDILYYQVIETESKYEVAKAKPIKTQEDIKALADMKIELNDIEREQLANKFRTHEISGNPLLNHYELPNLAKISIPKQSPREEAAKPDHKFGEGLSGVFGKTRNP